ncbi:CLUMA_CG019305, isoform A [Clunio marinus]|uniref:CLUMA_CG019305, isoform A n=1 Tax=Clunio marinus TaxID=568069 RepID=A0A1J1J2G8_9DIPT|nr:CLUMA_CG019305, isoform A [Clunio marinus]
MKSFIPLFVLLLISHKLEAQNCPPGRTPGIINVCRHPRARDCIGVGSGNTCENLGVGSFDSGFTSGLYQCTIYSGLGCRGDSEKVDKVGPNKFRLNPRSILCPCV